MLSTGPADELIAQAENQYAAGLADYRAGNLEKARQEFDRALGILLESKVDVETDERLSAEFDKLVDDIHGVELAAIERGDTLSEHKYEAPPIESFAGLTFPVDPKVKQQVQQEIKSVRSDLPLISNDLVDGFITLFQKHARHYMQMVLERRGIYEQMISEELRRCTCDPDCGCVPHNSGTEELLVVSSRAQAGDPGRQRQSLGKDARR